MFFSILLEGNVRLRVTPGDSNPGEAIGESLTGDISPPAWSSISSLHHKRYHQSRLENHQKPSAPCVRRRVIRFV